MTGYVVVDVETTGFVPERTDRIIEIALVFVSADGHLQGDWSTLINPQRDLGPTHIHGINAADVWNAPTFADIAPALAANLRGRAIVAHNAQFDRRFLVCEFKRAGIQLPASTLPAICTLQWSSSFLNSPSRKLSECCAACGIPHNHRHSAAGDAEATAHLLRHYLNVCSYQPPWRATLDEARTFPWPAINHRPLPPGTPRSTGRTSRQDAWLDRIVAKMPRATYPQIDEYLAILEIALLDGVLSQSEQSVLVSTASALGIGRQQLNELHASYLQGMADIAWQDGIVTSAERNELETVAQQLGLTPIDVAEAISHAQTTKQPGITAHATPVLQLNPGDRICFTGAMARPRDEWDRLASGYGLIVGSVTKKTRLVVSADPNSLSGKAAKARSYGIPIVNEQCFTRMLTEQFD